MAKSGLKWRNLLELRCPRCGYALVLISSMYECPATIAEGQDIVSCGFSIRAGERDRLCKGMHKQAEDARWSPEANQEGLSRLGTEDPEPEVESEYGW